MVSTRLVTAWLAGSGEAKASPRSKASIFQNTRTQLTVSAPKSCSPWGIVVDVETLEGPHRRQHGGAGVFRQGRDPGSDNHPPAGEASANSIVKGAHVGGWDRRSRSRDVRL